MTVESRFTEDGSALIINIRGKFDFKLLSQFRLAYSDSTIKVEKIIIDMRDTSSIDSSALGMLLNMQRHLGKADGEITITNCNQDVSKIFQITHFDKKFRIE